MLGQVGHRRGHRHLLQEEGDREVRVGRRVQGGAPPARFVVRAGELRQLEREQNIPYTQMCPYVELAGGTVVRADRSVPLA